MAAIDGVSAISGIDNDTSRTDSNGIPPHSIAIIADGGDTQAIADAIFRKKGPGTGTYGNTSQQVFDRYDVVHNISFSRSVRKAISAKVTIVPLTGYETGIGERIRKTVADFIDGLAIGESLMLTRLYLPASRTDRPIWPLTSWCRSKPRRMAKPLANPTLRSGSTNGQPAIPLPLNWSSNHE